MKQGLQILNYQLENFLHLSKIEKKMVLDWRNSETIKKWMYNQNDITIDEHLNFIDSLKHRKDKLYFILKNNNEYLGVVDFTEIEEGSCYYGFYANPKSKVPGIGRILEKVCLEFAFNHLKVKKLKLEVFKDNIQVKNLHKKHGFEIISEKIVNGKEVDCMELVNENR